MSQRIIGVREMARDGWFVPDVPCGNLDRLHPSHDLVCFGDAVPLVQELLLGHRKICSE